MRIIKAFPFGTMASAKKLLVKTSQPDTRYPVARPAFTEPSSGFWDRHARLVALVVFVMIWVGIGGFVLPRGRQATAKAPGEQLAAAQAGPTNQDVQDPAQTVDKLLDPSLTTSSANLAMARPLYEAPILSMAPVIGDRPLEVAQEIDQQLDRSLAAARVSPSPLADDPEFLRRVYLDITGRVPTYEQALAFLDSQEPDKRSQLIDQLLASPDFGQHFANVWTDLIVKRDFDNNKNLRTETFHTWLADKFNQDEKWDRIVTSIITAEGDEQNPATFFFLANQDNNQPAPNKLVDATGNLFLGIHIQCAECHVHPFNDKWSPQDFWGLAAFFGHTRFERADGGKKGKNGPVTIVDLASGLKADGKRKFSGQPAPAGATIGIPDPTNPQKILKTVPAKYFEGTEANLGNVKEFRLSLARWLTSPQDTYFAPALVNRTWAQFFGRGFVNPVDDMQEDNTPSHPDILKLLADEFTKSSYDVKGLVRAICNTRAYQRTSRPLPENAADEKLFSRMAVKVLSSDMLLDSLSTVTGNSIAKGPMGRPDNKKNNKRGNSNPGLARFFDTQDYDADMTEFTSGVPQVLRLMNSNLSNNGTELIRNLVKTNKTPEKSIEAIYFMTLSRGPSPAEVKTLSDYVAKQKDPVQGYAGVFWALLNSAEFACNR